MGGCKSEFRSNYKRQNDKKCDATNLDHYFWNGSRRMRLKSRSKVRNWEKRDFNAFHEKPKKCKLPQITYEEK
jgi:hypothetical protein